MKKTFLLALLITTLFFGKLFSQKKVLHTKFISDKIIVDANFDELAWQSAEIATNFVMLNPDNGKPIENEKRTEVKVVYTNEALYVAAKMYDPNPTKIARELTLRDDNGNADNFGVFLNGQNDGQQDYRFYISDVGVQYDCVYTEDNDEDYSWNAIWSSAAKITDYGWAVEMKIPYAAIRFSSNKKQTWGLNFYREIRNERREYTWNLISNTINSQSNQAGILEGIENIQTPTRLFFIPYTSFYANANDAYKTTKEFKGGLDIKYGINDAFTLDAILVPDFGQTKYDNVVLNLGPFEQQFDENRPFFTEGTELFNKGNIFYSRRIGGSPSTYPETNANEEVQKYPTSTKLLNALKVSGRTSGGLGIGVLNAITSNTFAILRNTDDNTTRKKLVEPLTNYNILVLDQRFNKNCSMSFVNTNVFRAGEFRDANVSALVWDLNTKKNTYKLAGNFKTSFINQYGNQENQKGISTALTMAETSGKFRFLATGEYVSRDYDSNDFGINYQTHYHSIYTNVSYRILNPTKTFNSFNVNSNSYAEFDNRTGRLQSYNTNLNFNTSTKKNDYIGYGINTTPFKTFDFYEPRSDYDLKYVTVPKNYSAWFNLSSNYSRKFAIDFNPSIRIFEQSGRNSVEVIFSPRYRFTNKFSLVYAFEYLHQNNNIGWIAFDDNNTIMARRNRDTYNNSITAKYTLNNAMNLNLSLRHYWSYAINNKIYNLQNDGLLLENTSFVTNKNSSFNTLNLDLSYSWWFAPGSQLSVLYRNNAVDYVRGTDFSHNYKNNLTYLFNNERLNHIFSISVRYYVDYNMLKNIKNFF